MLTSSGINPPVGCIEKGLERPQGMKIKELYHDALLVAEEHEMAAHYEHGLSKVRWECRKDQVKLVRHVPWDYKWPDWPDCLLEQ